MARSRGQRASPPVDLFYKWLPDDLVQPHHDLIEFLHGGSAQSSTDPFERKRSYLADFHPRPFGEFRRIEFQGEGEARSLRLACDRHSDNGSGTLIKDVVTEYQYGLSSRLLHAAGRVKIRPPYFASQYAGHPAGSSE